VIAEAIQVVERSQQNPVIVHVPHSARNVPVWARASLTVTDAELSEELNAMTDAHTDLIARTANEALDHGATLFINRLSRMVVDPERFPDDREEMCAVGMGAVYTNGHDGRTLRDPTDKQTERLLIAHVFEPYAHQLTQVVERTLNQNQRAVIIDLHSFPETPNPYELHADQPRPQICIGVDQFHTGSKLLEHARDAFADFELGVNAPFAGTYVPMKFYGSNPLVQSIMIEIRRDPYLDRNLAPKPAAISRLGRALARLIDSAGTNETASHDQSATRPNRL
jgi:N-formylglutamate deformylase